MYRIDPKDFALSVVSGNPCEGKTPEDVSENAAKLYMAAVVIAKEHNSNIDVELKKAKISKRPSSL